MPTDGEVSRLLECWSRGDRTALEKLTPLIERELRRMAASYLRRERQDHTLQPTALVNELYLQLIGQRPIDCHTRSQFFGIAANLMRQILIKHAERRRVAKRGGGHRMSLEEGMAFTGPPDFDLIALDRALDKLARLDPRQGRIVELRVFGGLTADEIAEFLGLSAVTVMREWRSAKAALHAELSGGSLR